MKLRTYRTHWDVLHPYESFGIKIIVFKWSWGVVWRWGYKHLWFESASKPLRYRRIKPPESADPKAIYLEAFSDYEPE